MEAQRVKEGSAVTWEFWQKDIESPAAESRYNKPALRCLA